MSLLNNMSYKIGSVIYIDVKVLIVKDLGQSGTVKILGVKEPILTETKTFAIGKGMEWDITDITYGYIGSNSVVTNAEHVKSGDYLHINTWVIEEQ